MISLLHLSKLIYLVFFFILLLFQFSHINAADDIWGGKENSNQENNFLDNEEEETIKSPILKDDSNIILNRIDEQEINQNKEIITGLFDPELNDFNLNMWATSDGNDVQNVFNRINKLKLSNFSENLLLNVLFTNAYPPKTNLSSSEFLKIKIDWLIKNKRFKDLENLLMMNPEVGKEIKIVKFLINENISNGDMRSACEKINIMNKNIQNNYLEKFIIYCLINDDRKIEAQIIFDLLKERGFSEKFFENKINFLLGLTDNTNKKILDNNLLNFHLSYITSENFDYKPDENTDKYIWRYLSSFNLIKINVAENEEMILTYEKVASENSFDSSEIFNMYKQILFNVNQLINALETYKTLPSFKARALIYQSILLSDNVEKKLYLTFLLKELFHKDKISNIYSEELSNILKSIDKKDIPENYSELVQQNLDINLFSKKIKFDNEILHRSKVLRHFIDGNNKKTRTEKDFKNVYKKIKKNKKYFISIQDIIVLESLKHDGIKMPKDLNFSNLSSQLTVPKNLEDLVNQNQTGLVLLKLIEIIGEDDIKDLDPETIYFLNRILNKLNLKKIRNNILSAALPVRI